MPDRGHVALSNRERQLLKLAAGGLTDSAIANRLQITEATVSTYWRRIRVKLGSYSRTELVATILRNECERVVSGLKEENRRLSERIQSEDGASSDLFFRRVLNDAAEAILVVSTNGTIRFANESASDLFGWTVEELANLHISKLVPARFHDSHQESMVNYVEAPSKRKMGVHLATPAVHRSGTEIPIAANLSVARHGGDVSVICVIRSLDLF